MSRDYSHDFQSSGFLMDFLISDESFSSSPPEDDQMDLNPKSTNVEQHNTSPNIKMELKLKIQNKYLSQGKTPIAVSFDPPPKYELTEDEKCNQEKRKRRNRDSANKSRLKRKHYEVQLEENLKELESDNLKLQKEVEMFRNYERKLRYLFTKHLLKCTDPNKLKKTVLLKPKRSCTVVKGPGTPVLCNNSHTEQPVYHLPCTAFMST